MRLRQALTELTEVSRLRLQALVLCCLVLLLGEPLGIRARAVGLDVAVERAVDPAGRVQSAADIGPTIEAGKKIPGIEAVVVIVENQIGLWGGLELVPLAEKKVEF